MRKKIIIYAYAMYLGFMLAVLFDAQWNDWRYYAVMIPTVMLVEIKVDNHRED